MLLELAGVRTHVVLDRPDGSESGPPVVLSSGLAGNWFDWDAAAELLAVGRRVIRFDRPGYGLSDPWPDGAVPTVESESTRIRELLDALEIERAVLVGHSMSSFYVEAFARLHPGRIASVMMLDGSVEDSPHWVLPGERRDRLLLRLTDLAAAAKLNHAGPLANRILGGGRPPSEYAAILSSERYLRAAFIENGRYPVLACELLALRERVPLPDGLPATVAAADSGRWSPLGQLWLDRQQRLATHLHASFSVIAPSGHMAMIDQPAQVAALVLDLGGG